VRAELGVPVDIGLDYAFFGGVDDVAGAAVSRHALAATGRLSFGPSRLYLRSRIVDRGDGFGLGRLGARLRHPLGRRVLLVADLEERFAGELAYDLAAADSTDVVDARTLPALGLEPPLSSTRVGARADIMVTRQLEAYGFGRVNLVQEDTASHYNNSWQELGGALALSLPETRVTASTQVKVRRYGLDGDANLAGGEFADTSGSGISQMTELSGEARYRMDQRKGSAAVGAYYRVYAFRSPYAEVDGDGRGGARVEADYLATRELRLLASGELAQPSPTMARELSALASVRLIAEAKF
jgi:hypothetical protein